MCVKGRVVRSDSFDENESTAYRFTTFVPHTVHDTFVLRNDVKFHACVCVHAQRPLQHTNSIAEYSTDATNENGAAAM